MTAFPEDFLQTIVGVGWGGGFAILQFNAITDSIAPGSSGIGVRMKQLIRHIPDGVLTQMPPFYNKQTKIVVPGRTVTTHSVEYLAVQENNDGVTTNYSISVSENVGGTPPNKFWSWFEYFSGATNSGFGGLSDAEADAGGRFIGATVISDTTGSVSSPDTTIYHNIDNAIFMFDLRAIEKAIGPKATVLDILCGTPDGPALGTPPAPVGFSWAVIFSTYKSGTFNSFPVNNHCTPNKWPKPYAVKTMRSAFKTPVPGTQMDFAVNLKSMNITASRSDLGPPPPPKPPI